MNGSFFLFDCGFIVFGKTGANATKSKQTKLILISFGDILKDGVGVITVNTVWLAWLYAWRIYIDIHTLHVRNGDDVAITRCRGLLSVRNVHKFRTLHPYKMLQNA